jgi:hypothetical protein
MTPQNLALTSPTSGGRSVGIVRLRTKGHGVFFTTMTMTTTTTTMMMMMMKRHL